ncbi:MAG TPA: hypothetical protein VM912_16145 [Terriglobales bacterium]|nr:hypothetical protein [Terriglobales bacterium]
MKKLFVLLFIAGVALCATTANAQTLLRVTIPFDFVVRGEVIPASTYMIRSSLQNDGMGLVFEGDGPVILARATASDYTVTGAKLVFRKIGDEYFLSDVVSPAGTLHFARSHREVERLRAGNQQSLTTLAAD